MFPPRLEKYTVLGFDGRLCLPWSSCLTTNSVKSVVSEFRDKYIRILHTFNAGVHGWLSCSLPWYFFPSPVILLFIILIFLPLFRSEYSSSRTLNFVQWNRWGDFECRKDNSYLSAAEEIIPYLLLHDEVWKTWLRINGDLNIVQMFTKLCFESVRFSPQPYLSGACVFLDNMLADDNTIQTGWELVKSKQVFFRTVSRNQTYWTTIYNPWIRISTRYRLLKAQLYTSMAFGRETNESKKYNYWAMNQEHQLISCHTLITQLNLSSENKYRLVITKS